MEGGNGQAEKRTHEVENSIQSDAKRQRIQEDDAANPSADYEGMELQEEAAEEWDEEGGEDAEVVVECPDQKGGHAEGKNEARAGTAADVQIDGGDAQGAGEGEGEGFEEEQGDVAWEEGAEGEGEGEGEELVTYPEEAEQATGGADGASDAGGGVEVAGVEDLAEEIKEGEDVAAQESDQQQAEEANSAASDGSYQGSENDMEVVDAAGEDDENTTAVKDPYFGSVDSDEDDGDFFGEDASRKVPTGPFWICANCTTADNDDDSATCECGELRGRNCAQISTVQLPPSSMHFSRRPTAVGYDERMTKHRMCRRPSARLETGKEKKDGHTKAPARGAAADTDSGSVAMSVETSAPAVASDAAADARAQRDAETATADSASGVENAKAEDIDGMGCAHIRRWLTSDHRELTKEDDEYWEITHPERPDRLRAIHAHLKSAGLLDGTLAVAGREASDYELSVVHETSHCSHVCSIERVHTFDDDTYMCEHSAVAAKLAVGTTIDVVQAVMDKRCATQSGNFVFS
eukprot:SAG11_NODE_507_length_8879_cov_8.961048_2_plen_521_part_00